MTRRRLVSLLVWLLVPASPARGGTLDLFATDIGSDGLFVLDLDTGAGTRMSSIPGRPGLGAGNSDVEAIAFDPDHGDFLAIEHFTNSLVRFGRYPQRLTVVEADLGPGNLTQLSRNPHDGLFYTLDDDRLWVFDRDAGTHEVIEHDIGCHVEAAGFSRRGVLHAIDRSTVPTEGAESLILVDVATRTVTRRVLLPPGASGFSGLAVHPTTGALFASTLDRLWRVDIETGATELIGSTGSGNVRSLEFVEKPPFPFSSACLADLSRYGEPEVAVRPLRVDYQETRLGESERIEISGSAERSAGEGVFHGFHLTGMRMDFLGDAYEHDFREIRASRSPGVPLVGSVRTAEGIRGCLIEDGEVTLLGTLDGDFSELVGAYKVDGITVAVGNSTEALGNRRAIAYESGDLTELGTLGGPTSQALSAEAGVTVGSAELPDGSHHAFLYRDSGMVDLGTLGGANSVARDVSEDGETIVGEAETTHGTTHAFLYRDGEMTDLGTLSGEAGESRALAIGGGLIAGTSDGQAVLWDATTGEMATIASLVRSQDGWEQLTPTDCDGESFAAERGVVVGRGVRDGEERGFALVPCSTDHYLVFRDERLTTHVDRSVLVTNYSRLEIGPGALVEGDVLVRQSDGVTLDGGEVLGGYNDHVGGWGDWKPFELVVLGGVIRGSVSIFQTAVRIEGGRIEGRLADEPRNLEMTGGFIEHLSVAEGMSTILGGEIEFLEVWEMGRASVRNALLGKVLCRGTRSSHIESSTIRRGIEVRTWTNLEIGECAIFGPVLLSGGDSRPILFDQQAPTSVIEGPMTIESPVEFVGPDGPDAIGLYATTDPELGDVIRGAAWADQSNEGRGVPFTLEEEGALIGVATEPPGYEGARFTRGDFNLDGAVDISDPVAIFYHLFVDAGALPFCLDAGDSNDDGSIDLSDGIHILQHLFRGEDAPGYPDKLCGRDLTLDPLTCEEYPPCE